LSSPTTHRAVLVLGRRPSGLGWPSEEELRGCSELIVLAIGWPLTDRQQRAVDDAEQLARAAGIVLDAILVPSITDAGYRTEERDLLRIDGARRETRKMDRTLSGGLVTRGER
jgi:hypothetical protein